MLNFYKGQLPKTIDGVDQFEEWRDANAGRRKVLVYNIDDNFVSPVLIGSVHEPKFQVR